MLNNEINILRSVSGHENFVKLLWCYKPKELNERIEEKVYIIMPLYTGGTLFDSLLETMNSINEDHAKHFMGQLCKAIQKLREIKVVHLDLKPCNLLLSQHWDGESNPSQIVLKVTDFGSSFFVMDEEQVDIGFHLGTDGYRSPEMATSTIVSKKVDIWSVGVILYEMLVRPSFQELDKLNKLDRSNKLKNPPSLPMMSSYGEKITDTAQDLILKSMTKDIDRYCLEDVLAHKWFKKTPNKTESGRFLCDLCTNTFLNSKTLNQHKSIHHGSKVFWCPYEKCDRSENHPNNHPFKLAFHCKTHVEKCKFQ